MNLSKLLIIFLHIGFFNFIGCGTLSAQTRERVVSDTCSEKSLELKEQILEARSCSIDSDCSLSDRIVSCQFTPCYGYPVNRSTDVPELEAQLSDYENSCSEPLMCACPPIEESPRCILGLCTYPNS